MPPKKGRRAESDDDEPGAMPLPGGKGGRSAAKAAVKEDASLKKPSRKGKRGVDSDEEEPSPAQAQAPVAAPAQSSAPAPAGAKSGAKAKSKGAKGRRRGADDDEDDDDNDAGEGALLAMPSAAKSRLALARSNDDDGDKDAKPKPAGGKKSRKGGKPRRQDEEDDEEGDANADVVPAESVAAAVGAEAENDDDAQDERGEESMPLSGRADCATQSAPSAASLPSTIAIASAVISHANFAATSVDKPATCAFVCSATPSSSASEPVVNVHAADATTSPGTGGTDAVIAASLPPADEAAPAEADAFDFGKRKKKKKAFVFKEEEEPEGVAAAAADSSAPAAPPALAVAIKSPVSAKTAAAPRSATALPPAPAGPLPAASASDVVGDASEASVFYGEAEMGVVAGAGAATGGGAGYTGSDKDGQPVGYDGEPITSELSAALYNLAQGKSLSNRERKLTKAYEEERAKRGPMKAGGALTREGDEFGLRNFALSQQSKAAGKAGAVDAAAENAKDVVIENFSINANKKQLFVNAQLRIAHGRRYGLVGPNGQGKSTLLKYMASRELAIPSRIDMLYVEQEVVADETPAIQAVLKADKRRAALLEEERAILAFLDAQDADDAARARGARPAGAAASEAERGAREDRLNAVYEELAVMKADASEALARSILAGLGFTPDMQERPTRQFSGGWRMRISLARALFMQPDLLLLDEPTNHLDLNAVIWLEDYLGRWRSTLLVVSHDQDFLSGVVTDIIHLEEQKLHYYKGNYDDFKAMHQQKMEKQQKDYDKQQKLLQQLKLKGRSSKEADAAAKSRAKREGGGGKGKGGGGPGGGGGAGGGSAGGDGDEAAVGEEHLVKRPREYVVHFAFKDPEELPPPVLSVNNVSFRYGPKYPYLFRDLNFGIDQKSRVAIVGPNGVGKSTLLNLLIGDLQIEEGEVARNRFLEGRVGKYSQHFVDVLPMDKAPVEYVMSFRDDTPGDKLGNARALLGRFGLESHAHKIPMRDLSGGQKARVVFAGLALQSPYIMVLDEPTNNLDIESIDALGEALTAYRGGVVLVSHDSRLIRNAGCHLWVCDKQTVKPFDGDIDDYRESMITSIHKEEEALRAEQARAAAEEEARRMAEFRKRVVERKKMQVELARAEAAAKAAAKAALAVPAAAGSAFADAP